jgi:hypothetical protein
MNTFVHRLLLATVVCGIASLSSCSRIEPDTAATPAKPASKVPDWRGVWSAYPNPFDGGYDPFAPSKGPPPPGMVPPYKPEYLAQFQQNLQQFMDRKPIRGLNNGMFCTPAGLLVFMIGVYPMQFVVGPDLVAVVSEYENRYRLIYTDGRAHRPDAEPTYQGDSVGHWEGDTLVVETTNMRTDTTLGGLGEIHSEQARVVERIRRVDSNWMEIESTVHDAVMLTEPWVVKRRYELKPDWALQDYNCRENNRNEVDAQGIERTRLRSEE